MFTDELDTFIIYNERKRVTSSAKKKRRQTDKSLHQVSVFVVNIVECWVVVEIITCFRKVLGFKDLYGFAQKIVLIKKTPIFHFVFMGFTENIVYYLGDYGAGGS